MQRAKFLFSSNDLGSQMRETDAALPLDGIANLSDVDIFCHYLDFHTPLHIF